MVDQVKTLLLNPTDVPGYRHVTDIPSDVVMGLFDVSGGGVSAAVDKVVHLALAPDLSRFRRFYDQRTTPPRPSSIYRQQADSLSPAGLYARVLGYEGQWGVSGLFRHDDPGVAAVLDELRTAVFSGDAAYALGAVLLTVAYRRWLLQGGGG